MKLEASFLVSLLCVCVKITRVVSRPAGRNPEDLIKQVITPKILEMKLNAEGENSHYLVAKNIIFIRLDIPAFGNHFVLDLTQSRDNKCLYNGFVNASSAGTTHFNLCNGLDGIFYWNSTIYFVKPLEPWKRHREFSFRSATIIPHLIYFESLNIKKPMFSCREIKQLKIEKRIPQSNNIESQFQRIKRNIYPVIDSEVVEEQKIELLIVVTSNFMKRFKNDLKQYILHNVAIASNLLRHPTINASISIEIVDIISLDKDFELRNNLNDWSVLSQDRVVTRFCQWLQEKRFFLNYYWDSAILINDGYFSTNAIGIAHLRSMCNENNCLAVVDRGFGTGFIIAHELAHQMNARHDFDDVDICRIYEPQKGKEITYNTIMSTSLYFDNYPFVWSPCSQYLINSFLRSKHSSCLRQRNKNPNLYSHEYIIKHLKAYSTGVDYDLNQQCSFAFNEPAQHCNSEHNKSKKCSALYCRLKRHPQLCIRADAIIADGTECDLNKHCVHGRCVEKGLKIEPIDGGWSDYSPWSNCSRLCDGGIEFSYRLCNSPTPSFGGKFCVGTKERIRSCNVQQCSSPDDPRETACKAYGLKPYIPQVGEEFACNLVCISNNDTLKYDITLTDGTPCSPLRSDICVKGTCYKTGCDRVVGSTKIVDHCNRCGGRNDTCVKKKGFYDGSKEKRVKMKTAFKVPANVTNLFITKVSERTSPYSEEVWDDFELLLVVEGSTIIRRSESSEPFAGGYLYYSGTNKAVETIEIQGQINKEIIVIITVENENTQLNLPSITYHYFVPKLIWKLLDFSTLPCKGLCNGYIEVGWGCFRENDNVRVSDEQCSDSTNQESEIKSCSSVCGYRWMKPNDFIINTEMDKNCPLQCGNDKLKIGFICQESISKISTNERWINVNASLCLSASLTEHPYMEVECPGQCIPPIWSYGKWQECPVECGTSFKYRQSYCTDHKGVFYNDQHCLTYLGPSENKDVCISFLNCSNLTEWIPTPWSVCSATCDEGVQTRNAYCFRLKKHNLPQKVADDTFLKNHEQISDSFCQIHSPEPPLGRSCMIKHCFKWHLETNEKCSVTCGNGSRIENYICIEDSDNRTILTQFEDDKCLKRNLTKPKSLIKQCSLQKCPVKSFWKTTEWNKCSTSCGEGIQERTLQCGFNSENGTFTPWPTYELCTNIMKPNLTQKCEIFFCPEWIYSSWSECAGVCLYGRQHRTSICVNKLSNDTLLNEDCKSATRGPDIRLCHLENLCGYWKIGKWSQCSVSCGSGVKRRKVTCHYHNGTRSRDFSICRAAVPFDEIHCQNKPCSSTLFWWFNKTSECYSNNCNPGIIYADVKCVNDKFERFKNEKCRHLKYPIYYAGCLNKKCLHYFWTAEPWDNIPCHSNSCLLAVRSRKVSCVDDFGKIHPDSFCKQSIKPDLWRLCPSPKKCSNVSRSCKELKENYSETNDGEYNLAIDLNWTYLIYCADMNTNEPKEYLTLKELNFARSSKFTSSNTASCVFNEEIEYNDTCPNCEIDDSTRAITYYDKIRINMADLSVDVMDHRFSITNGAIPIPYATAKDCANLSTCPMGHFKIDLRGTGFSVSMRTAWFELYSRHSYRIVRTRGSQIVKGWCGGPCSGCSPLDKLYIEPQMYGRDFQIQSKVIL